MITILKTDADNVAPDFAAAVESYRQALLAHRFSEPAHQHLPGSPAVPPQPAIKDTPAVTNRRGDIIKPARPGRPAIQGKPARPARPAHPGEPRPTAHPLIEQCVGRVQTPGKPDDFVTLPFEVIDNTEPAPTLRQKKDRLLAEVSKLEQEKINDILPQGKFRLWSMLNNASLAKKAEERSDAENEYITKFAELTKAQEGFHISAARLMSDVEDLTEENIDSWVPKF